MTIVEFLRARLDAERARLDELDDLQSFPPAVYWVSRHHTVTGAGPILAAEIVGGPKAFVRFYPGQPASRPDWGWVVNEHARELFSQADVLRRLADVEAKRLRLDYLQGMAHETGGEDFVTYDSCRILASPEDLGDEEVGYCSCGLDSLRDHLYRIEALPFAGHPDYDESWRP